LPSHPSPVVPASLQTAPAAPAYSTPAPGYPSAAPSYTTTTPAPLPPPANFPVRDNAISPPPPPATSAMPRPAPSHNYHTQPPAPPDPDELPATGRSSDPDAPRPGSTSGLPPVPSDVIGPSSGGPSHSSTPATLPSKGM
jgi:hypothetical protein